MGLKSFVEKMPGYNSLVRPVHFLQAWRAGKKLNWPAKKLRVIGVTGTNGKTTTCFMIWKMLNESGRKTGLLTTVGWSEDGETLHQQVEHMTTERVEILNERMRAVADAGAEFLVLEVTSHALMQFRTLGVPIEVAVFTNLTPEHLDYHKTFENYRKAKLKLFKKAKYGVVNADDESVIAFVSAITSSSLPVRGSSTLSTASLRASGSPSTSSKHSAMTGCVGQCITYGINNGDLKAENIELKADGVAYKCGDLDIKTQIPGEFNVYNSLAAVGVGKILGLSDKEIETGIYALEAVEGRMNRVRAGQGFEVIIDYAHTPDALEKVFSSAITSLKAPVRGGSTLSTASLRFSLSPCTSSKISTFSGGDSKKSRDDSESEDNASSTASLRSSKINANEGVSAFSSGDSESDTSSTASLRASVSAEAGVKLTAELDDNEEKEKGRDRNNHEKGGRIISVHGGAGRRDHGTREPRGEILGKNSDIVIITEDDSRDEDPREIAEMFVKGAQKAGKVLGKDLFVELDREKAIRMAVKMAKEGDIVLILGKGHEKTILRADGAHEFEDAKVAEKVIKEMLA